jgi:hypothetical protein
MTLNPRLLESAANEQRIENQARYVHCAAARRHAHRSGRARLGWLLIEAGWRLVATPRQPPAAPGRPAIAGRRLVR